MIIGNIGIVVCVDKGRYSFNWSADRRRLPVFLCQCRGAKQHKGRGNVKQRHGIENGLLDLVLPMMDDEYLVYLEIW